MTDTINVPVATLMRWEGELDQIKGAGHISDEIVELFNSQAPAQPAPVQGWQMVPPERIKAPSTRTIEAYGYRNGWNDCLDEVARLNAAAPKPPVEDGCVKCGKETACGKPLCEDCCYEPISAPQPSDDVAKALKTAANRMQRLALEVDGDWRGYATEWAEEALAAIDAAMAGGGE